MTSLPTARTEKAPAQRAAAQRAGTQRAGTQRALVPRRQAPMPSPHHPAGHLREGRHRRPPDPRARYGTLFRNREFRWLSAAQALSFLGDQFAQVAIALLVYDRTGSPLLTAVAYALTYLPPIAGGPLLSWLADVFPRRRVMVACDLIRMATVGLMAFRGMPFWALCALLICTVLLGAPFFSARAALMPDILPGNQLGLGSAVGNMLHQSTQILGFVAGAAVVAALGSYRTLALDALSFGVSAIVVLAGVRPRPAPQRADTARGDIARADAMEAGTARAARMRSSTARHAPGAHARQRAARGGAADGIRLVFGNRLLRTLMLFGWLAGFYVMPEGLAAPYAHALGGDAVTVGLLMASVPAGTALGAALVGRLARPSTQLWTMGWLAIMSCAPLVASICDPPLWAVLSLWVLAGVGGSFQVIAIPAFARILTPAERGRAFGVAQSGLYAVQGIGILAGGAIADVLGAPTAVGLSGVAGMLAAAGLAMNWTRLRRRVIADLRSS